MSRLNATCYFNEGLWRFDFFPNVCHELDIAFGFDIQQFSGLSFGFSFRGFTRTWPDEHITYHASYEDFIHIERNFMVPGETVTISFVASNSDQEVMGATSIEMPKPTKPHKSWVWDSDKNIWVAPIPEPSDESNRWHWNEEQQRWVGFPRLSKIVYLD